MKEFGNKPDVLEGHDTLAQKKEVSSKIKDANSSELETDKDNTSDSKKIDVNENKSKQENSENSENEQKNKLQSSNEMLSDNELKHDSSEVEESPENTPSDKETELNNKLPEKNAPLETDYDTISSNKEFENKDDANHDMGKNQEHDVNKAKLEQAKDAYEYAKNQFEEYDKGIELGQIEDNPDIRKHLENVIGETRKEYQDLKNAQSNDSPKINPYGEGFGKAAKLITGNISSSLGIDRVTSDNIKSASNEFGKVFGEAYGPMVMDGFKDRVENLHDIYTSPAEKSREKYMQGHFLRDENGTPLTASEARENFESELVSKYGSVSESKERSFERNKEFNDGQNNKDLAELLSNANGSSEQTSIRNDVTTNTNEVSNFGMTGKNNEFVNKDIDSQKTVDIKGG